MAYNVSLTGNEVTFQGDASDDALTLNVGTGGILTHNIPLAGSGLASATDLDPTTAGTQSRTIGTITGLTVNGGSGNDSLTFGGGTNFNFNSGSGCTIVVATEALTISVPTVNVASGSFSGTGSTLNKSSSTSTWSLGTASLSLNYSDSITINSTVTAGRTAITGGVLSLKEVRATAGDVQISSTANLTLPNTVAAAQPDAATANVNIVTTGDLSYRHVSSDGGNVSLTGGNITSLGPVFTEFAGINTTSGAFGGSATLTPSASGTISLTGSIWTADLTLGTNAGISGGGEIKYSGSSLNLTSAGDIALTGRVSKLIAGSVSLTAGGNLSVSILSIVNNDLTATAVGDLTLPSVRTEDGDLTLSAGGAVTAGTMSFDTLSSQGTTFTQTSGSKFFGPTLAGSTQITLNHSDTVSLDGGVTVRQITSTGAGTLSFGSTSQLDVVLGGVSPFLSAVGNIEFAAGATVNIDPSNVNVENVTIYDLFVSQGTITDNGLNLVSIVPIDNDDEYTLFVTELESPLSGGMILKLYGYVREDVAVNCSGTCTLSLDTDTSHFGPSIVVRNSSGMDVTPANTPVGLVDSLLITGGANLINTLNVDYLNGDPLTYDGLGISAVYDGGTGTGNDNLFFIDSNGATNGAYVFDTFTSTSISAKMGTIEVGAKDSTAATATVGSIGYLELEGVTTELPIAVQTVNFTTSNDTVTLTQQAGELHRFTASTITPLQTPKPTLDLFVNGGAGTDSLTFALGGLTAYNTSGANTTIQSENITQQLTLTTSGGNIDYSGSGTFNGGTSGTANFNTSGGTGLGTITISQGAVTMLGAVGKGEIAITANAGNLTATKTFSTTAGNMTFTASGNLQLESLNAVNSPTATISVTSTGGNVTATSNTQNWTTNGGPITISAAQGTMSIGNVTAGSTAPQDAVSITALGAISTGNLKGSTLSISNTTGNISTAAITLSNGDLVLSSPANATIGAASISKDANSGAVNVTAVGSLTINGNMSTNGGPITLQASNINLPTTTTTIVAGAAPDWAAVTIDTSSTTTASTLRAITGASITINAAGQMTTGALTANAGAIAVTGGAATTIGAANSTTSIAVTTTAGNISAAAMTAPTIAVTSAGTLANTGAVTSSAGPITLQAAGNINGTTASATGGPLSVTSTGGNVTYSGNISAAGQAVTVAGNQLSLVGVAAGNATVGFGALSLTSNTAGITFSGVQEGAQVTMNSATTITGTGTTSAIRSQTGDINMTSNGNITLGADVTITATANTTATLNINSGSGTLSTNSLFTNGGAMTLSGGGFTSAASKTVRTGPATITTSGMAGLLTMNFTGSIRFDGPVQAGSFSATAGTTFTTAGSADIITIVSGGASITAPGGISLADALNTNSRQETRTPSTLDAGANGITLRGTVSTTANAIRTFGGDLTMRGSTLAVNGVVTLFESSSRMGIMDLNFTGNMTINSVLRASRYVVNGTGNMNFAATSGVRLHLYVNVLNPQVVFQQTGGGSVSFPASSGGITVNGYGTTSIDTVNDYTVFSTTGTFTYATTAPVNAYTTRIASITVQTANKRVLVRLK